MVHPEVADIESRFSADEFAARRRALRERVGGGLVLIPAHPAAWRNADNRYPFRQNSHFLYFAPLRRPGLALVLDVGSGEEVLFGPAEDPDDLVWHGPHPSLEEEAGAAGLTDVRDIGDLPAFLRDRQSGGQEVLYLPPYVAGLQMQLARWLEIPVEAVAERASEELGKAVAELRLVKSEAEVAEIESVLEATAEMFGAAFYRARAGIAEADVRAEMARVAYAYDLRFSFNPIVTVRGEVLHNESYGNVLRDGDLLLVDAGLESEYGYGSDITRTLPVSGRFSGEQRGVYEVVLTAQQAAIQSMRPGTSFRELHLLAARVITEGLKDLGLMRGDPAEAVAEGAHALFFAHGLGHPLGLDVHDLQDLGDSVAYPKGAPRSEQFGLRFLRFARPVQEGMVMTVEPGIYFIPALIDRWRSEGRHEAFIDYDRLESFHGFGGIRLEDDVLCTEVGARVLGPGIPLSPDEVESVCAL